MPIDCYEKKISAAEAMRRAEKVLSEIKIAIPDAVSRKGDYDLSLFVMNPATKKAVAILACDRTGGEIGRLTLYENTAELIAALSFDWESEMKTDKLRDGVSRQGDYIKVPDGHPRWPGLRGDQKFAKDVDGYILKISDLDADQRTALFE